MDYKVLETTTRAASIGKALNPVTMLPRPICFVIIKDGYDIASECAYQDIIAGIKKKVPVMCEGSVPWAAKDILSKGQNAILIINSSAPGDLHHTLSDIQTVVENKGGSIVGICVKSARHSPNSVPDFFVKLAKSGVLSCAITAYL